MCDAANGPYVDTLTIGLLLNKLWCHVEGRAENLTQAFLRSIEAGEPEVCQLQIELAWLGRFLRCQQNVFRLQISVDDVLLVHVVKSKEELLDGICCLALAKRNLLDYVVVELSSCNQFSYDIKVRIVLEQLIDSNDMRMICVMKNLKFLFHQV